MKSQESRRYPIGKFEYGKTWSLDDTRRNIKAIARFPKELKKVLKKLKSGELDSSYRRGGWTTRQVVHHLADSHMNAYVRMKLAVTEQTPIIKPYEEANWAETEDAKNASIKLSLRILAPLHKRWVMFLESLSEEDLERGYFHPELQRVIPLPEAIALYAWHGQHHTAHIRLIARGKASHEEAEKPAEAPSRAGRKPRGQKTAKAVAAPADKRTRRSSAEVAAEKAAKAAAPKLSRAEVLAKARAARAAKQAPAAPKKAAKAAGPKLSRAEILAKARAAKQAPATPKKADKAAKAAGPKLSRAEVLAKARAARAAKLAQKAPAAPKAKPSAQKAAKPAGETKRKGLSPERMAEIRAMRGKKK